MLDRKRRKVVEQSLVPGQLRDQHHADQEEIDVSAFAHAVERVAPWQQAAYHQCDGSGHCPDRFGQTKGPNHHPGGG